jgi:hypothetical protein
VNFDVLYYVLGGLAILTIGFLLGASMTESEHKRQQKQAKQVPPLEVWPSPTGESWPVFRRETGDEEETS